MTRILILYLIVLCGGILSGTIAQTKIDFNSPKNIIRFADFLFCQKDYLRSVNEYQKYLRTIESDTVKFKVALANYRMEKFETAASQFQNIGRSSSLKNLSNYEYYNSLFRTGSFPKFQKEVTKYSGSLHGDYLNRVNKLYYLSFLLNEEGLPSRDFYVENFSGAALDTVLNFYDWKKDPPYKSPAAASILSAVIPGSGKIYTGNYGDAAMAFVSTGLFGFLAYDNFHAKHNFRGWLFSAISLFFYAGNVYGSYTAAQIYNAKIKFQFEDGIKIFIENNNYYNPDINFCN